MGSEHRRGRRRALRPDTDAAGSPVVDQAGAPRRTVRPRRLLAALTAGAALAASGCIYGPDPNITFVELATNARAEGVTPWFCQSSGVGGAMGEGHGPADGLAHDHYAGQKKGVLDDTDCLAVAQFFDKAMAVAKRFPTRGDAKAHKNRVGGPGMIQSVQFVPGMGTHDLIAQVSKDGFDPERPMFFQYDGSGDDARLAGLSWFVQQPEGVDTPPEGFPGGNDWWHSHATLCYYQGRGGTVVGSEISDEECERRGGKNEGLPRVWMIHAWIMPGYENVNDVFSGAFACVRGTGPAPADDPCRDDPADAGHSHGGGPAPSIPPGIVTPTTRPAAGTGGVEPPAPDGHGDHAH